MTWPRLLQGIDGHPWRLVSPYMHFLSLPQACRGSSPAFFAPAPQFDPSTPVFLHPPMSLSPTFCLQSTPHSTNRLIRIWHPRPVTRGQLCVLACETGSCTRPTVYEIETLGLSRELDDAEHPTPWRPFPAARSSFSFHGPRSTSR